MKPVQLIAEVGLAHDGSLGMAHAYIDALAPTGVHAVKFQMHIAEAESSPFEPFRVAFAYQDTSRIEYWKRTSFTFDQWIGLKQHCEQLGMEFIASPFSNAAIDILEALQVTTVKIPSGEMSNWVLLHRLRHSKLNLLLSSGMSTQEELDEVIDFFHPYSHRLTLLQCTSSYPTIPEEWGIHLIPQWKERYNLPIGFSDHSGDIFASLAAVNAGASVIEAHVVFDKRMFGPDAKASLTIEQMQYLVTGIKQTTAALENTASKTKLTATTQSLKAIFEKSLATCKDLPSGHELSLSDLEPKKPCGLGIHPRDLAQVVGKKLLVQKLKGDFIHLTDLVS